MFDILKVKSYRWLWISQFFSSFGDQLRTWTIIFWVFAISDQSPIAMTLVLFAQFAPVLLLGPLAGVWVDRLKLTFVMRYSSMISALLSFLTIPALMANNLPAVLVLVGLSSVLQQFFRPATNKLVVAILPKDRLMAANSLSRTTKTSMDFFGPILGTGAYQLVGAELTMLFDGLSYLLTALCIVLIPYRDQAQAQQSADGSPKQKFTAFWREFADGVQFGWRNQTVRAIFIIFCMMSLAVGAVNLLGIFLVTQDIGLSENYVAWGYSVQGVGMVVAAILLGAISKRVKAYRWLSVGGLAVLMVGIVSLALSPNFWILFISRFMIGLGITILTISVTTLFQIAVPKHLLGRIGSVLESVPTLAMLFSIGVAGYLQSLMSARVIFLGAGTILLFTCIVVMIQLGCIVFQRRKPFIQIQRSDKVVEM